MKAKVDYTLKQDVMKRRVAALERESNVICMYRISDDRYDWFKVIDRKRLKEISI